MAIIRTALSGDMHINVAKRSDEAFRIAWWMGEDWKRRGVHLIGIGGDLVDGPMTERERAKLIDLVVFYASFAKVVIDGGNHEVELSLQNALGKIPNVIVDEGAGLHYVETEAGAIVVACVSFPKKAALLAAVNDQRRRTAEANKTEYRPVSGEEADQIAGQALQDVFRGIGTRYQQDFTVEPMVALVHGTIKGSKVQPDDQPDRPLGLDISLADIALMQADFVCAPHIHLAQEWQISGTNAWCATPSSPFFSDYGEAKHFKGYIIAEFDTDIVNATPGDCAKWSRIPTPATPMLLAEYEWNGEMFVRDGNQLHESDLDPVGADIRFRFRFASDQRAAATEAANGIAGLWRVSGAVNVTLDPVQTPTTRARIPTLTTTVRLEDKLKLYWRSIDFNPSPEREAELIEMLHELQEAAAAQGLAMGTTGRAAPSLHKFRGSGMFKFDGEFELNFNQIAGPLTAIVAPNECGKTILVQLMGPGLLYGSTPTRGTIDDLAIDNGAFIEGEFSMGGAEYKLTQVASTKSRTGRTSYPGTVSLLKDGKPELGNKSAGGRDEYAKWIPKNLLPPNVYDAVICQSGTESVIDMKDGPRVELLLRVLGLEIYEALAKMARDRAAVVAEHLSGVRARIEEIGEADLEGLQTGLRLLRTDAEESEAVVSFAERSLNEAREQKADFDRHHAEHEALITRRDELAEQVTAARTKRSEVQTKIDVGKELTGQRAEIEKAVADVTAIEAEIAALPTNTLQVEYVKAQAAELHIAGDRATAEKRIEELTAQDAQLTERLAGLQTQTVEAQAVVADADAIREAVIKAAEYESSLKSKQEEDRAQRVREAQLASDLRDVRARIAASLQKIFELTTRKESLEAVIATKEAAQSAANDLTETEADILRAETELSRYREEVEFLQKEITTSKDTRITGLFTGHREIAGGLAEPVARARKAMDDDADLEAEAEDNPSRIESATKKVANCEAVLKALRATAKRLEPIARDLQQVRDAETSLITLTAEIEQTDILHMGLVKESEQVVSQQEALVAEMEQTQADLRWLDEQIKGLSPLVARAEVLATADTKLQGLAEQTATVKGDREQIATRLASLQSEIIDLTMAADDAAPRTESLQSKIISNDTTISELRARIEPLQALASKSSFLTAAIAAEETLLHHLSQIDEALEALEHKHDGLEHQVDENAKTLPKPGPTELSHHEKMVANARAALAGVQTQLAVAENNLKDAQTKEGRRQSLAAQVRGLEERISNCTALAQHLGKDGLQKMEIECSAEQLTSITNDLLRAGGDYRHTVTVQTERLSADRKRMIPCLDFRVYDSTESIEKESRRLSEGGKQLVGTPLGLSLIILGCQRAGISGPTIFLDEVANNLDAVNTPRFIGSLRRFAEILGGDARIVFISQDPQIWDLADSRIFIEAGKLRPE